MATTLRQQTRISALLVMVICASARLEAGQIDQVARARALAIAGQRGEAITLLEDSVAVSPGNSDARVLLGTVLSWEGRYDEARRELDTVLAENPGHGDALLASINVEFWSHHPARAEELVERLLTIQPRNAEVLRTQRLLQASLRLWQVRAGASYDTFNVDRVAWREWQASVARTTPVGSMVFRGLRAQRFGLSDNQLEFEANPSFTPGTYASLAVAYSREAILYPRYRYAADVYQRLGAGFEGSAGFRRLGFGRGVSVYAGSLSKYAGNWLFTGRLFVTPSSAGTSRSLSASVRRYFGGRGAFVGGRYGRGGRAEPRNRNDFDVLDSDEAGADTTFILNDHLDVNVMGSYSRENRAAIGNLRRYSLATGLGFRF